jgi:hypothetical protein
MNGNHIEFKIAPLTEQVEGLNNLSDVELFNFMRFFYHATRNIVSYVAEKTGHTMGYVQKVMNDQKPVRPVLGKFCIAFREKLTSISVSEIT